MRSGGLYRRLASGPHVINRAGPSMSESDRMARISEIETRFRELCSRNSIAPDEPVAEEMRERVSGGCFQR